MQVQKEFPEDGELMLSLGGCVRISSAKRGQRPLGRKDGKGTGYWPGGRTAPAQVRPVAAGAAGGPMAQGLQAP